MRVTRLVFVFVGTLVSVSAFAQGEVSIERGLQVSIVAGCHDCHTEGYSASEGKIDPQKALKGNSVGFRGPWGTSYASNLRYRAQLTSERGFVVMLKNMRARPPMPWYNIHEMDESDLSSLYLYIKSLGAPGEYGSHGIPPNEEPTTPYIQLAPPLMPAN